jgi:hypothetical protein
LLPSLKRAVDRAGKGAQTKVRNFLPHTEKTTHQKGWRRLQYWPGSIASDLISKLAAMEAKILNGELHQVEIEEFINYWFIEHMAAVDVPLVVCVKRYMATL